jgi:hypothetical protein
MALSCEVASLQLQEAAEAAARQETGNSVNTVTYTASGSSSGLEKYASSSPSGYESSGGILRRESARSNLRNAHRSGAGSVCADGEESSSTDPDAKGVTSAGGLRLRTTVDRRQPLWEEFVFYRFGNERDCVHRYLVWMPSLLLGVPQHQLWLRLFEEDYYRTQIREVYSADLSESKIVTICKILPNLRNVDFRSELGAGGLLHSAWQADVPAAPFGRNAEFRNNEKKTAGDGGADESQIVAEERKTTQQSEAAFRVGGGEDDQLLFKVPSQLLE